MRGQQSLKLRHITARLDPSTQSVIPLSDTAFQNERSATRKCRLARRTTVGIGGHGVGILGRVTLEQAKSVDLPIADDKYTIERWAATRIRRLRNFRLREERT